MLEVERVSHDCILAEETFRALNGPIDVNGQRASALRFADPKVQALWHGLVLFRVQANDFRHADLRRYWAALTGRAESQISQGAITYQLRRLRLHGLIERLPKTHRYSVTAKGLRAALFCTRSYTRILPQDWRLDCPATGRSKRPCSARYTISKRRYRLGFTTANSLPES